MSFDVWHRDWKDFSRILIYGYGVEGKSSEAFIKKHFPHVEVEILDDKTHTIQEPQFETFDCMLLSPGVNNNKIPRTLHKNITSNTDLFFRYISETARQKTIGITGSKGKTSTVKFFAEFLQEAGFQTLVAGNIGSSLLDSYEKLEEGILDFLIIELSSFQLESLQYSPATAILLNIFPEHLERHKTFDMYFSAKKNIYCHQKTDDMLILPSSFSVNPYYRDIEKNAPSAPVLAEAVSVDWIPKDSVLRAYHMRENLGVILPFAEKNNIKNIPQLIRDTATKHELMPHRLEYIATKNNIDFYNDSIATNPESTRKVISFFRENLGCLILGGVAYRYEDDVEVSYSFDDVVADLRRYSPQARVCILESPLLSTIKKSLLSHGFTRFFVASSLPSALHKIRDISLLGKVCVLSPGAKSFYAYKSYIDRGNDFSETVRQLS